MTQWKLWWICLYAVGLVLIPPIHFHDRLFFASEWLLLPLFLGVAEVLAKGQLVKPSKELIFVWGACTLAFVAGVFRGDLALKISIYDLKEFKFFSFKDDGIVFLRTMVIFSTPWLLQNVLGKSRTQYLSIFVKTLKVCILISAALAILDYPAIGIIKLQNWGFSSAGYEFWASRARGTFYTPIEASFMYGAMALYLLTGPERLTRSSLNLTTLIFSLLALVLTHGGTAMGALLICVCASLIFQRQYKKREIVGSLGVVGMVCFIALLILPHRFFYDKFLDFIYRFRTYGNYLGVAPHSPWILLTGIGFSRVCADNNFIDLFIQGGVLLFIAALNWVYTLYKHVSPALKYIFIFWFLTWLSFDTLGYWGIGRLCWFLFGL